MITCSNCGMENASSRAFCAVCGERLPSDVPIPVADTPDAGHEGAVAFPLPPVLPPWLEEAPAAPPPAAAPPPDPTPPAPTPRTFLPDWLQGAELLSPVPAAPKDEGWAEDLDFSDLPDWDDEAAPPRPTRSPLALPGSPDDPIHAVESEGVGLLAGIRGPIPIEPVIKLLHDVPPLAPRIEPPGNEQAANLFAQIAGGAVVPAPLALPQRGPRPTRLLHLLLVVILLVPLLLRLPLFAPPVPPPAALSFAERVAKVPDGATVLLAFDYEGGLADELDPAARATLGHLRQLQDAGRTLALVPVSTLPLGPALAERACRAADVPCAPPLFLPGGSLSLRSLAEQGEVGVPMDNVTLIIVFASEAADIQRWIEQVGSQRPETPLLAAAPAASETVLTPYLASGQLGGLLAGTPATAGYETHLGASASATRRLDAVTLGALALLAALLLGNLAARRTKRNM